LKFKRSAFSSEPHILHGLNVAVIRYGTSMVYFLAPSIDYFSSLFNLSISVNGSPSSWQTAEQPSPSVLIIDWPHGLPDPLRQKTLC